MNDMKIISTIIVNIFFIAMGVIFLIYSNGYITFVSVGIALIIATPVLTLYLNLKGQK